MKKRLTAIIMAAALMLSAQQADKTVQQARHLLLQQRLRVRKPKAATSRLHSPKKLLRLKTGMKIPLL